MATRILPKLPYEGFPLRPHRNGHWYRSIWNSHSKKSEQFYFGSWVDDPKGERAMRDPEIGWLVRRDAIMAGIDNARVQLAVDNMALGDLMARFLTFKRGKVVSGELSLTTLNGYLQETERFVSFQKPSTPVGNLRPEHFSAYMRHLIENRKLGRFARKRVVTYINTFIRYGSKNGWVTAPNCGTEWVTPATDPDSMRLARARAGVMDYSERIVSGTEIDKLLDRSQPAFKAMILLGVNCGLGPADLGRLRWNMLSLNKRKLTFPRPKTGVMRVGYIWHKTRDALLRVRTLKHNQVALAREGESSLVFITRKGLPYYREAEVHSLMEVGGEKIKKLVGVRVDNAVLRTFRRMARELELDGVSFYRLRHTFKTLGKKGRDREALDLMMGHRDRSCGRVYDHEEISMRRVRRVAKVVYQRLWPKKKPSANTTVQKTMRIVANGSGDASATA
jgi:integrase